MKLQIKTQFWDSKVLNDWRKRYSRIGYWVGIFSLPNIFMYMLYDNWFMFVVNIIPLVLSIVITISYNKRSEVARI